MPRALTIGSLILGSVLITAAFVGMQVGASDVSVTDAIRSPGISRTIIFQIRLPRIVLAGIVGAILALSGATFQTLLRNPLADPFILGVSGGAACGAALATALGLSRYRGVIPSVAFAGACLAIFTVVMLARTGRSLQTSNLLLAGLVLNAFFSALILLSLSLVRGTDLTLALRWMMGSFFSATWADVLMLFVVLVVSFTALMIMAGEIRMMEYGEEDARSRGVHTERVTLLAFLAASMATGAAVSVSGIIGFVGLLVPHGIRMVWKSDYRALLPLSALGGGALLVAADSLSRSVAAPAELPIGALTALLGVPFFLVLLRKSHS